MERKRREGRSFYIRKAYDTWGGRCVGIEGCSGRGCSVDNKPL